MFSKYIINNKNNRFNDLLDLKFDDINIGRKGAILVKQNENNKSIPLVRTTSIYDNPVQNFKPIHQDIIKDIIRVTNNDTINFNNAMIEIYDDAYIKMQFHTDQSLDLHNHSYICVFSCYENPDNVDSIRKLIIKKKGTNETSEILLNHNSIVLFSVDTNKKYLHKIIKPKTNHEPNRWLGVTFRLSKTFITFKDEIPYFVSSNKRLTLATEEQRVEFLKHKGKENTLEDYSYPDITYSINKQDFIKLN
jgi:hypothetical protein